MAVVAEKANRRPDSAFHEMESKEVPNHVTTFIFQLVKPPVFTNVLKEPEKFKRKRESSKAEQLPLLLAFHAKSTDCSLLQNLIFTRVLEIIRANAIRVVLMYETIEKFIKELITNDSDQDNLAQHQTERSDAVSHYTFSHFLHQ